jgi:hypothetical protein
MAALFFSFIVVFFLLLGKLTWGTGEDVLDWDPVGRGRRRRALDREDTEDLLELANLHRREHGLPELREEEVLAQLRGQARPRDSTEGP